MIETARQGSTRAGRSFQIVSGGFIATGPDDATVAARREWVRSRVGFYGSTPAYRPMFHHHDLGDLGTELHALSKAGRWDDMTTAVGNDALDQFCVAARHDQLADAVARHYGGIVDVITLDPEVPADVITDLQRIPTRSGDA